MYKHIFQISFIQSVDNNNVYVLFHTFFFCYVKQEALACNTQKKTFTLITFANLFLNCKPLSIFYFVIGKYLLIKKKIYIEHIKYYLKKIILVYWYSLFNVCFYLENYFVLSETVLFTHWNYYRQTHRFFALKMRILYIFITFLYLNTLKG